MLRTRSDDRGIRSLKHSKGAPLQIDYLEPRLLLHGGFDDPRTIDAVFDPRSYVEPAFDPALAGPLAQALPASQGGQWGEVVDWTFRATHAAMLHTGKVIMFTKRGQSFEWDPSQPDDQVLQKFARLPYKQFCAGHVLLPDGRFMVVGGHIAGFIGRKESAVYDPIADKWTVLPNMNAGRWYPSATVLPNGDVAVLSGSIQLETGLKPNQTKNNEEYYIPGGDVFEVNPLPQVWDAARGRWRDLTGAVLSLPLYPRAFVAPNGKLFIAGPGAVSRYLDVSGTGQWTTVATTNYGIRDRGGSVMYDEGKVLIFGGAHLESDIPTATAEVIDLNDPNPSWRYVDSMTVPRKNPNTTILADGSILVVGGVWDNGANDKGSPVYAVELWDPETEKWTMMNSADAPRWYHSTTTLLPDGRVLAAGGNATESGQVFSPPYLFKGPRPVINAAPDNILYGTTFDVATTNAQSITDVHLIRLGSTTHSVNFDQRILHLDFSVDPGTLHVTAPDNANLAPPGYYMLFILQDGVPSVSKIMHVSSLGFGVASTTAERSATAGSLSANPALVGARLNPKTSLSADPVSVEARLTATDPVSVEPRLTATSNESKREQRLERAGVDDILSLFGAGDSHHHRTSVQTLDAAIAERQAEVEPALPPSKHRLPDDLGAAIQSI